MHLQDAYRPHLADAAFNSLADCLGFVFAVGDNHDFFRVSDGADPDGQRCLGDEVDVIVEKTGVGFYGIHGQGFDAGARGQGRSRLVKRDMAVSADAADEKVDFAVALDFFFIITAFGFVVFGHAVQDVDVFRLDIDMFEKAFFHEKVVAFVVFRRQADIFVHIESDDIFKRDFSRLILADEFAIHTERRGSGRQSQDKGFFRRRTEAVNFVDDIIRRPFGTGVVVRLDYYAHSFFPL